MRPTFVSHNVRLDDGSHTMPEQDGTLEDYSFFRSAKRTLEFVFPQNRGDVRIADLGCLEGGYATLFARMGFQTVGIEVRQRNYDACLFIKENVDLPNLSFEMDDVWNSHKYGEFDAIFCSGLLYHLDRPKKFLEYISPLTGKLLLLKTHFAPDDKEDEGAAIRTHALSSLQENEGIRGRWQIEFPDENLMLRIRDNAAQRQASHGNTKSFWPQKGYLLDILQKVGFDIVYEQFDSLPGHAISSALLDEEGYYKKHSGNLFVGIKTGS